MGIPDALVFHRVAHRWHRRGIPILPTLLRAWIFVVYNCAIPFEAEIGEGTRLAYNGIGVVIHRRARIGRDVVIGSNVTIGGRSGSEGVPVIEDGVHVATGAKILGDLRIGAGAVVGANAVVIDDVPAGAVVGGIPARILSSSAKEA